MSENQMDSELLQEFDAKIVAKVPHQVGATIANPTPIKDITSLVVECAREEYGIEIGQKVDRILGKFESEIYGGSVKVRPAVQIIRDAIATGRLRRGQIVFEATSGNFGISLGLLQGVGLEVVALVSRKLQRGVIDELRSTGVKIIDLDAEICPAPGMQVDMNVLAARASIQNLRSQLAALGLDTKVFDESKTDVEGLLSRQDVINLAKLLARIYDGFCPEQYDNEMNVNAHETITGPEIDQQLKESGESLGDFKIVSSFGTGGTSAGISGYLQYAYGKKGVHVVFPASGQDVAGIRTRANAEGLRFYQPGVYAGEHEVDYEQAKKLLRFFTSRGLDIGESAALALFATIQLANFGIARKFFVLIPDGMGKYAKSVEPLPRGVAKSVSTSEARAGVTEYGRVVWTHSMFVPKEEGLELIASTLGCQKSAIKVVSVDEVDRMLSSSELPDSLYDALKDSGRKHLFVCMAGVTSLRVAQLVAQKGIDADNLSGGIMFIASRQGKAPADLVEPAQRR